MLKEHEILKCYKQYGVITLYDNQIPAAWLTLCDDAFVILLIPFLNYVVYPFLDKKNITTVPLCRIGIISLDYIFIILLSYLILFTPE